MKKIGQITGFKQVARPYALRYGAGKAFNENGYYCNGITLGNTRIDAVRGRGRIFLGTSQL
jgi:hypothetical protein